MLFRFVVGKGGHHADGNMLTWKQVAIKKIKMRHIGEAAQEMLHNEVFILSQLHRNVL